MINLVRALWLTALAWGALAFGAVYPWAFWPLAAAMACVGIAGAWVGWPTWREDGCRGLAITLGLLSLAASLQLLPVPRQVLASLSPEVGAVLRYWEPGFLLQPAPHATTIDATRTTEVVGLLAAFTVAGLGGAMLLSRIGARPLAAGITVIGVILAVIGIVQQPLIVDGRIYGFWTPNHYGTPFGPFINKNHFAGWMLMALPLAVALVNTHAARHQHVAAWSWRRRWLWLSTREASLTLMSAASVGVMALSLVLTLSRSGIVACMLACAITAGVVGRVRRGTTSFAFVYVGLVALAVVAWTGVDVLAERFGHADWSELEGRAGAWADARDIIGRFPLVGTGLGTYGVATLFYQRHQLAYHFAHAHNDYLQLAAEGGVLVVVPAVAAIAAFAVAVRRRFLNETSQSAYLFRVGAVTGLMAIAFQEVVDFSLQMPGNGALFVTLCAIALHRAPARRQHSSTHGSTNRIRP